MRVLFSLLPLFLSISLTAQIDVGIFQPGTYGSSPGNSIFEIAIQPTITYTFPPAAAELNMIIFAPLSQVDGTEVFSVTEDLVNGGAMGWDPGQNFDYGDNRYFVFTYSGTGINLTAFPQNEFSLAFTVGLTGGTGSTVYSIADQNSEVFQDFALRAALNLQGVNQFNPLAQPGTLSTGALPLELISFEATPNDRNVQIDWETANELNVSHIEIERRHERGTFNPIGSADAKNLPSVVYRFVDTEELGNGTFLYRLKIVDLDGSTEYSPIRSVSLFDHTPILYPNPASTVISLFNFEAEYLQIQDIEGTVVFEDHSLMTNTVPVGHLPKGTYIISLYNHRGERLHAQRIILQ